MRPQHKRWVLALLVLQVTVTFVAQRWELNRLGFPAGILLPAVGYGIVFYSAPVCARLAPAVRVLCLVPLAFLWSWLVCLGIVFALFAVGIGDFK